ncbi:MAG: PAS domain S-box protein [Cyclobacteriaceae bacterium]|nr:PAS domain S-box protein [Cyclobacteriaceae bacterium]
MTFFQEFVLENFLILITDKEGRLLFVNDALCKTTDYRTDQLLGINSSLIFDADSNLISEIMDVVALQHKSWSGNLFVLNKEKDSAPMQAFIKAKVDREQRIQHIYYFLQEIPQRCDAIERYFLNHKEKTAEAIAVFEE